MSEAITLANLGGGAAVEKFQEELDRVIANILDPNTEACAKREILLKVVIKPDKERQFGDIGVATQSKLAPSVAFLTRGYFGQVDGRRVACENNPRQTTIEDFITSKTQQPVANVLPLEVAR